MKISGNSFGYNNNYSVEINKSLLSKSETDEKTAIWLKHNLSLIPKGIDSLNSSFKADGGRVLSCKIKINGYDNMTTEVHSVFEADPGTDKEKELTEEQIKRRREERKAALIKQYEMNSASICE